MNMLQVIAQVEQLPGLKAGQGDVPQAVVLHHLTVGDKPRAAVGRATKADGRVVLFNSSQ